MTLTAYERAEREVPAATVRAALAAASPVPFWLDDPARPPATPPLAGDVDCDLAVVGGGFCGLWTALRAKERDPGRRVVLLEAGRVGWAASGRNGGFCEASLTHGETNGRRHLPDELDTLERMGRENLAELVATVERYGIDCDLETTGVLNVATEPHQVAWLAEEAAADPDAVLLDADAVRREVRSPLYRAGLWSRQEAVMVNPAKLVWGLRRVCAELGVELHERTPVRALDREGATMVLRCDGGPVRAARVALATNAFRSLLRRVRPFTVPVYDYVLVTEPLTGERRDALGWRNRQGVADLSNRFHYYRLTADDRLLFGGYDAVYHFGKTLRPEHDQRPASFERLAAHVLATFPQLAGVRFTHAWGGAIDTCSRFFSFFTTGHGGRVAAAAGFTGLGVGATRFAADVMLDLLDGEPTERTRLRLVRSLPKPFPPEPVAWAGVRLTTAAMARADRNGGRRGPWLRLLDALKMGFDS